MSQKIISINRAPVLTLWAAIVAERLGFDRDEALSLGKALAGLNAQTKGRRLGICKPHEEKMHKAREKEHGEQFWVELLGRPIPAKNSENGVRAVTGGAPIEPDGVARYLESKFAGELQAARSAMRRLAKSFPPKVLAKNAFGPYERFRPEDLSPRRFRAIRTNYFERSGESCGGMTGPQYHSIVAAWRRSSSHSSKMRSLMAARVGPSRQAGRVRQYADDKVAVVPR